MTTADQPRYPNHQEMELSYQARGDEFWNQPEASRKAHLGMTLTRSQRGFPLGKAMISQDDLEVVGKGLMPAIRDGTSVDTSGSAMATPEEMVQRGQKPEKERVAVPSAPPAETMFPSLSLSSSCGENDAAGCRLLFQVREGRRSVIPLQLSNTGPTAIRYSWQLQPKSTLLGKPVDIQQRFYFDSRRGECLAAALEP